MIIPKPAAVLFSAALAILAVTLAGMGRAQTADASKRLPDDVVTDHTLELPGRKLKFQATAGAIPLRNSQGRVLAEMGYVSYTMDSGASATRPVTFALNGGPGSASAWLHIGGLGPWRLRLEEAARSPSAPAHLLPNAETWLDFTDLVFIDPVGTGYSKIVGEESKSDEDKGRRRGEGRDGNREEGGPRYFWSLNGDVESISEFIQIWLQKNGRLASPKLLVGESYGGFRAPKIARTLQNKHGIALNGLVLVSPVLDFAGRRGGHPPLAFVSLLPSLAAAEMERQGEEVSRNRLRAVETYARDEYLKDLMRGPRDTAAVGRIVARVAEITGLPEDVVKRYGGRIDGRTYDREVNRPQGKMASMYDASIRGLDPDPASSSGRYRDPFTTALNAPMTSAMNELYGNKLNYRTDRQYVKMNSEVNRSWIWGNSPSPPESVSDLKEVLALDQHLRVLVVHGYTDFVTPYFASELILDQLPAYGEAQRVSAIVYPGGHMFYSRDSSRKSFREDGLNLVERIIVDANETRPPLAPTVGN